MPITKDTFCRRICIVYHYWKKPPSLVAIFPLFMAITVGWTNFSIIFVYMDTSCFGFIFWPSGVKSCTSFQLKKHWCASLILGYISWCKIKICFSKTFYQKYGNYTKKTHSPRTCRSLHTNSNPCGATHLLDLMTLKTRRRRGWDVTSWMYTLWNPMLDVLIWTLVIGVAVTCVDYSNADLAEWYLP